MIKIENTQVWGFEGAIRGMRNPYESGKKSDSHCCCDCFEDCLEQECYETCRYDDLNKPPIYYIGDADMTLAKKLIKAGPEHRKFLRMIHVQADVTAPRYWWAEMDKYKWVEANSSSTMHLITKRKLSFDDFSFITKTFPVGQVIAELNEMIDLCNSKDISKEIKEEFFMCIKQLLPESYNQLRTIDTNYEALLSIHHQRHNHRLTEWRECCEWIESLPYMEEFLEVSSDGQSESRT